MDFPFPCTKCSQSVCRRAYNMNLALGYTEEQFCLKCLADFHEQEIESMFDFIYSYIQSRDCFKKEWIKMQDKSECPLPNSCVINKCFRKTDNG